MSGHGGAGERYVSGLRSLLALEEEHGALIPKMLDFAGCERLRAYLGDQVPLQRRQACRLQLLLRGMPGPRARPDGRDDGLARDLDEIRLTRDADDRDAQLFEASLWISNLKIEQYVDTRDGAIRLGYLEHYRHLQRSLNAIVASSIRLRNIADRVTCMISGFGVPDMGWDLRERVALP